MDRHKKMEYVTFDLNGDANAHISKHKISISTKSWH
jgi:hypothetical protein